MGTMITNHPEEVSIFMYRIYKFGRYCFSAGSFEAQRIGLFCCTEKGAVRYFDICWPAQPCEMMLGGIIMKLRRQNRGDILLLALATIGLGVFNLVIRRFIDGALCIIAGIVVLLIWKTKRMK